MTKEIKMDVADTETNYLKYRGKCKEFVDEAVFKDPTLKAVRGHYYCPYWGEQAHWWCVREDGSIYDPTALQFPSKGIGEYVEFDGSVTCSNCGKIGREEDFRYESRYSFCSTACNMRFVGL